MALTQEDPNMTSADRIQQLSHLEQDVVQLLKSAGLAVRALAPPSPSPTGEVSNNVISSIDQQKEAFSAAASDYFTRLYSIDVGLRTQIHALEEAKTVFAEAAANYQTSAAASAMLAAYGGKDGPAAAAKAKEVVTGGGLGSLDVGWLNSRNDYVGKQMEAELWKQASDFLAKSEVKKV